MSLPPLSSSFAPALKRLSLALFFAWLLERMLPRIAALGSLAAVALVLFLLLVFGLMIEGVVRTELAAQDVRRSASPE